jgi:hypothetical protein
MGAVNKLPRGVRRMSDKLQFINLIGIYRMHNQWYISMKNVLIKNVPIDFLGIVSQVFFQSAGDLGVRGERAIEPIEVLGFTDHG